MSVIHERKCQECGQTAEHIHRTGEWVRCSNCESYSTVATEASVPRSSVVARLCDFEILIDECQRDEALRNRLIMCMSKLMRCLDKMSLVDDGK